MKLLKKTHLIYFETIWCKCTPVFKSRNFSNFVAVVCKNVFFYIIASYSDYTVHISINNHFVVHYIDIIFKILIHCPCFITKGSHGAIYCFLYSMIAKLGVKVQKSARIQNFMLKIKNEPAYVIAMFYEFFDLEKNGWIYQL